MMRTPYIEEYPRPLNRSLTPPRPMEPAATPLDEIARMAAAAIEREDGFDGCAEHRIRGAYDGDTEHRIALKAIELFQLSTKGQAEANNLRLVNR